MNWITNVGIYVKSVEDWDKLANLDWEKYDFYMAYYTVREYASDVKDVIEFLKKSNSNKLYLDGRGEWSLSLDDLKELCSDVIRVFNEECIFFSETMTLSTNDNVSIVCYIPNKKTITKKLRGRWNSEIKNVYDWLLCYRIGLTEEDIDLFELYCVEMPEDV